MSSVLDRPGLEKSPLADLHLLAGELGVENFRRLRKADLIDALLARQSGEEPADADVDVEVDAEADEAVAVVEAGAEENGDDEGRGRSRRGRRGGRSRSRTRGADDDDGGDDERADDDKDDAGERPRGRSRGRDRDRDRDADDAGGEEKIAEGEVELLANGSGFVRLAPPEPTDDDVYVSAAQVKRCELVSGDRVSGPVRAPRRSERFPSLIRVDTINGRPADESRRAPASRTCPPPSPPSASSSAPRTRPSRRSSG
jgi:transcription termination factor Rho